MENIRISVQNSDALKIEGDVLVMKYAQAGYGLDQAVIRMYEDKGNSIKDKLPKPAVYQM